MIMELRDLLTKAVLDEPAGVLVHLLSRLHDTLGIGLTSLDGVSDRCTKLVLVALLHDHKLLATLGGLLSIALHNTSELEDLALRDFVVLCNNLTELFDLLAERSLRETHVAEGIEAHAASGSFHGGVLLALGLTLGVEGSPDLCCGSPQAVLGMLAVACKSLADGRQLLVEAVSHAVQAASGLGLGSTVLANHTSGIIDSGVHLPH